MPPKVSNDEKLDFSDVLIVPQRSSLSSRSQVELQAEFSFLHSRRAYRGVPICAANMDSIGTFSVARALALHPGGPLFTAIAKHESVETWEAFADALRSEKMPMTDDAKGAKSGEEIKERVLANVAVSAGSNKDDAKLVRAVIDRLDIGTICLDVANGYQQAFVDCIRRYREEYGNERTLIAGNVVTPSMVVELLEAGADVVKVGIGPGSVCTTRKMTGVGYPQFSAVLECAEACHQLGGHIMSDGGCIDPGCIAKALVAGADLVMCGGLFAGHTECGGHVLEESDGSKHMIFYELREYRASEGRTVRVPYRGSINATISTILGGIRSTCTMVGAANIRGLADGCEVVRVRRTINTVFEKSTFAD